MDSFFTASKVLWFLAVPSNLLVILAALGLVMLGLRLRRAGAALVTIAVAGWLVFGFSPASSFILSPLEERFPLFTDDGTPVTGIIMLGGSEKPDIGNARGVPTFGEAGERPIAFAALSRRYPQARLAFVGGSGRLVRNDEAVEAHMIRMSLPDLGIPEARVEFEEKSRNTAENAEFARAVLKPKPGERWLLVTSAAHMPRAVGCFRKVGFDVVAYPVDFQTIGPDRLDEPFSRAADGLDKTDMGVREWVGLVVYYVTGKTSALFPAP
ncbi:YdcF family protein [Xanthobacter autotrophicus]|uniref:YdcF family protein n=1 Tax=Xanthobacter TaxID=279 RepID=UPI0024AB843B|nr:YdcF family protein [Xanthobacter autotrophicus]MDI4666989.1 YdcF family protein [Xanthobacter autotrophicus]